jgi:hypothetical protein
MLKFISRKIAFQWILLFGLFALSVYTIVTQAQLANEEGAAFLYKNFAHFFSRYDFFGKGIIIVVLLLQILLLQYYFMKNEFSAKSSLLPACFYLSILLLTKSLIVVSPLFFTLFFFLATISMNYTASSVKLKNNVFWIGALLALGTCFDLSSIILLVLVMTTLIINQFFKIKEIGILLFGFVLIYFYFFAYYFFTNSQHDWILTFQQIQILGILNEEILTRTNVIITLSFLAIVYIYFMVRTRMINEAKVVMLRKRVVTLNTSSALMITCLFISNSTYPYILGYLFVPIAIYLAILAQERSPLFINEIITIITLFFLWL